MKRIGFIVALFFVISLLFSEMNVFVDINRFKDQKGNTRFEIAYQIPYNQMQFQRIKNGYRAILKINLSLKKNGKTVYSSKPLLRQLIETNDVIKDPILSYQDKLHFSLSKSGFEVVLKFVDLVKGDSLIYTKRLINLMPNDIISDLELDNYVRKDTTKYKRNFQRNGILYLGYQNHTFNKITNDTMFVYYELYKSNVGIGKLHLFITKNDSLVYEKDLKFEKLQKDINPYLQKIDLSSYKAGYYDIHLQVFGIDGNFLTERKNFFVIKVPVSKKTLVFYNVKDDKKLVEYFLNSNQKKILRSLKDKKAINNYISKFWLTHDINPATQKNEFLEEIKKRVDYANEKFSSFGKGWKSDRGRIYIKYGKPDYKQKYRTSSNSKYPFKSYEVWQYRSNRDQTYIFFDMPSNNSYRLIYSGNDSSENTYPNWKSFLGEEFELNDLE